MVKCFLYEQGDAVERMYRGEKVIFCKAELNGGCPYNNASALNFAGEEVGIICTSKGLIDKVEEDIYLNITNPNSINTFRLRRNAKLPIELK